MLLAKKNPQVWGVYQPLCLFTHEEPGGFPTVTGYGEIIGDGIGGGLEIKGWIVKRV